MSKKEAPTEHKDLLGQIIKQGDYVAMPNGIRSLDIYRITKLTPKMVKGAKAVGKRSTWRTHDKTVYPQDCIKIHEETVTMYILTDGKLRET